jgi:hypothetical protein
MIPRLATALQAVAKREDRKFHIFSPTQSRRVTSRFARFIENIRRANFTPAHPE